MSEVPIVDTVIKWKYPYKEDEYFFTKNTLYEPSMNHNLIPPFLMRETYIIVNNVPKIHIDNPTRENHSIYFQNENIRILLILETVFYTFQPISQQIEILRNIIICYH